MQYLDSQGAEAPDMGVNNPACLIGEELSGMGWLVMGVVG